jgi:hypothetical protein
VKRKCTRPATKSRKRSGSSSTRVLLFRTFSTESYDLRVSEHPIRTGSIQVSYVIKSGLWAATENRGYRNESFRSSVIANRENLLEQASSAALVPTARARKHVGRLLKESSSLPYAAGIFPSFRNGWMRISIGEKYCHAYRTLQSKEYA